MKNPQFTIQRLGKTLAVHTPVDPAPAIGKKRARRDRPVAAITPWHTRILNALQGRQMFAGIDPDDDPAAANRLAKRRRRNQLAKASRKINRR